jgi:hypothetical protein
MFHLVTISERHQSLVNYTHHKMKMESNEHLKMVKLSTKSNSTVKIHYIPAMSHLKLFLFIYI